MMQWPCVVLVEVMIIVVKIVLMVIVVVLLAIVIVVVMVVVIVVMVHLNPPLHRRAARCKVCVHMDHSLNVLWIRYLVRGCP